MYPDPKRVRAHKVSVCLDAYEHNLLRALAEYQGEQLSVLLRELVVREAQQVLASTGAVAAQTAPAVPVGVMQGVMGMAPSVAALAA